MKTSELTGAQLDFWVAKALGYDPDVITLSNIDDIPANPRFPYSRDWTLSGPIIEREQISIGYGDQGGQERGGWTAFVHEVDGLEFDFDSPLVAAMRAFVASKFGEEVPDSTG